MIKKKLFSTPSLYIIITSDKKLFGEIQERSYIAPCVRYPKLNRSPKLIINRMGNSRGGRQEKNVR